MTERSAVHASFTIERTYDATPARVFAAWSTPEGKAKWFEGPNDWEKSRPEFDFRVGGRERVIGRPKDGVAHTFDAIYLDIVPNERIIYAYYMFLGEKKISASLATVELKPVAGGKTKLVFTEQGAFLDGYDDAGSREEGSGWLLSKLGDSLKL